MAMPPRVEGKQAHDDIFGGEPWQDMREGLITRLQEQLDCGWPTIRDEDQARVEMPKDVSSPRPWGCFFRARRRLIYGVVLPPRPWDLQTETFPCPTMAVW